MSMLQDMDKVSKEYSSGDRNYGEFLLGQAGIVGNKVGDAFATVGDYMVPDALGVGETVGKGIKYLANTEAGQWVGQQAEDFAKANPRTARALSEGLGASNLIGLGSLRRGLFQTDEALKGMHESSADVIVPNFYNPREVQYSPLVEKALEKISPDKKSATSAEVYTGDNKRQNAIRKALGFGGWAAKGISRVAENLVNPYNRATYAEYGMAPSYRDAYNKFMEVDKLFNEGKATQFERAKALDIAHSQMQQMANIRAQAGAKAKVKEASDPFMLAATDPNSPNYFKPNDIGKNWYEQTGAKGATIDKISSTEAQKVQDHVTKAWGLGADIANGDVKVVIKRPTGVGGNHFNDVVASNSRFKHALHVFEVGQKQRGGVEFGSVDELKTALEKRSDVLVKKEGKKEKERAYRVVGSDDEGVWITSSRAGSAKVEGGINMLMKVEPNGNITGYMSDLHDFLDKVPGVKNVLEYTLPTKVLAVTPPMQSNVYSVMSVSSTAKKFGDEGVSKRVEYPSAAGEQAAAMERVRESGNIKPSTGEVVRQSGQAAQNVMAGGMLFSTPEEQK